MNAPIECSLKTRQEWWKIVSACSRPEKEPKYRRISRRYACTGELKVAGEIDDEPFRQTWSLLQISAEGITARAPREVPNDVRVVIQWHRDDGTMTVVGTVAHCTQTIGGFKVGIKLDFPDE